MKDERLHRYFDGEMSKQERDALEAELTDEDRAKLEALGQMRALLTNALDREAASVDVWRGVEAQLGSARPARPPRRWRRSLFGASAGLVAAAAAVLLTLRSPGPAVPAWSISRIEVQGASVAVVPSGEGGAPVIWTTEAE